MLSSSKEKYVFHENIKIKLIYALFPFLNATKTFCSFVQM